MTTTNMNTTQPFDIPVTAENAMTPPRATQATTANEAAGLCFPKIAEHFNAFCEREAEMTETQQFNSSTLTRSFGHSPLDLLAALKLRRFLSPQRISFGATTRPKASTN